MGSTGFIDVNVVLNHLTFKTLQCTSNDIERIVKEDAKRRYTMKRCSATGALLVRANQGHSIAVNHLELFPVNDPNDYPIVVHGTYFKCWDAIKTEGLRRMKRNHIHLACFDSIGASKEPLSGFRSNCQLLIYIDMKRAMEAGIQFFRSSNNVILTKGLNGVLSPEFFSKIVKRP